jgi:DNA-binding NarL/FixJ family response regulator
MRLRFALSASHWRRPRRLTDVHEVVPDRSLRQAEMLRILIADDHDVVRSGLRAVLETRSGWEIVGEAADGRAAIEQAVATKPEVAIVDYSLPLVNGTEVTRQIRAMLPRTEVLIFTMHDSDALMREALQAGARGYVLKSDAQRYLVTAVESLAAHRPFFTGRVSEALLDTFLAKGNQEESVLTGREKGVIQLIAEGHTNKGISELLRISVKTVESHRASAMRKLNLSSTAALVRYAVRNKLVEP